MKLMTPKTSSKRSLPTPKPATRKPSRMPPAFLKKAKVAQADPDMDGDAGANEAAVAEQKEPAINYARGARKSGPTII